MSEGTIGLAVRAASSKTENPLQKLILFVMADCPAADSGVETSYAYISEACGISLDCAISQVNRMVETGLLRTRVAPYPAPADSIFFE